MNKHILKVRLSLRVILAVAALLCLSGHSADAQEAKKVGQLNFQVPEEWPVEKRGGLMTPIPTEEYVTLKFKEIEKEFQAIRSEFSEGLSDLKSSVMKMETNLIKKVGATPSQAQAKEPTGGNLADILSSLELVKNELARLDRKITNRIQEIQAEMETIRPDIESIKDSNEDLQTQIYRIDEKVDYLREQQPVSY